MWTIKATTEQAFGEDTLGVQVRECNFTGNWANQIGGAVYARTNALVEFFASHFLYNYAALHGGAIGVEASAEIILHNQATTSQAANLFLYNKAERNGGAIYINNDKKMIERTFKEMNGMKIRLNAAEQGGGLYTSIESGSISSFHYSNFPMDNHAGNGPNIMAFGEVDMLCQASRYFPVRIYRKGVPAHIWNHPFALSSMLCPKCPDGRSSIEDSTNCETCRPGRAGIGGYCNSCPVGKYQSNPGGTTCEVCEPGKYSDSHSSTYCREAPKPCQPGQPKMYLAEPGSSAKLSLHRISVAWEGCTQVDGYEIEISTHRSFSVVGRDTLYKRNVNGSVKTISIELNRTGFCDRQHFARIRIYKATHLAKSKWSLTRSYTTAD